MDPKIDGVDDCLVIGKDGLGEWPESDWVHQLSGYVTLESRSTPMFMWVIESIDQKFKVQNVENLKIHFKIWKVKNKKVSKVGNFKSWKFQRLEISKIGNLKSWKLKNSKVENFKSWKFQSG